MSDWEERYIGRLEHTLDRIEDQISALRAEMQGVRSDVADQVKEQLKKVQERTKYQLWAIVGILISVFGGIAAIVVGLFQYNAAVMQCIHSLASHP